MNAILVTGGAGFIGSCFVRQWIEEETSAVVVLDKLTYAGNPQSLACVVNDPRFSFYHGDIADASMVRNILIEHQIQSIVHFAAESHVDRSIDGPAPFIETNVVGTFQLLESAYRYWLDMDNVSQARFRFLHISTDEVYGSLGASGKFSESTAYAPNSPYAASKAASDHFVRAYHQTYGLPILSTNSSNNYGPFQFPEKLIPLMILRAIQGLPLPVYGDGLHVRDWLHVDDHCRALRMILKQASPGSNFNIGGNCELSNIEVVQAICAIVDQLQPQSRQVPTSSLIEFVSDRPGHDRRYAIDTTKIQREIGWFASLDFEGGLEQTVRWYLANEPWVRQVRAGEHRRDQLDKES